MKVGVINFSGNVGKTTISRHLLAPRMNGAPVVAIESINSDGLEGDALRGKQFARLQLMLQTMDDLVVDIGASNVEELLKTMAQYRGSESDFDYFVVPVVPSAKQQRDTVGTIEALAQLGVAPQKIRVVFNQVELGDLVEQVFPGLFAFREQTAMCRFSSETVIHVNEIFPLLSRSTVSIADLLADKTDYKAKIKASADPVERTQHAQRVGLLRLAAGVEDELGRAFVSLFEAA